MPGLHELTVSLTKNGHFKVADVIEKHPRYEVLNSIRGTYVGINLDRAQIANMLSADPSTKELRVISSITQGTPLRPSSTTFAHNSSGGYTEEEGFTSA